VKTDKAAKAVTSKDVDDFVADAEKAQEETSFDTDLAESHMKKGSKSAKAKVMYKARRDAPAPKAVYETYQAR